MAGIDSNTKLMLHMDGSDSGTVFTDDSDTGHTITRYNAVTKTGTKKFGSASGYFDGSEDYLSVADHDDFDFGTGDFTIDMWIYPNSVGNQNFIDHGYYTTGKDGNYTVNIYANGDLSIWSYDGKANTEYVQTAEGVITTGSWQHIAVVREGTGTDQTKIYVDGTAMVSGTISKSLGNNDATFYIGGYSDWASRWFGGFIDEFRVSNGIARWTENFTPPTSAYFEQTYKISGTLSDASRIIVIEEAGWTITSSGTHSTGSYEITTTSGAKMVIARKSDGESMGYGNVTPSLS